MNSLQAAVVHGQPALDLLRDQQFLSHWQALGKSCSHTTAFQLPHFVCAWYDAYGVQWQPVIVRSHDTHGSLVGLWLLAYCSETKTLVHAGAHQAEYHVWLTQPGMDIAFVTAAWEALKRQFPFAELLFKYLPSASLIEPLMAALSSRNVIARKHPRPLSILDAEALKESFAKKSNKSRFNRLKKLGTLEFRRVTDSAELLRVIDDLIDCYDFRQGAVNHVLPFREDPRKRKFHTDLFAGKATDETCVTATYLDEQVIAAFLGSVSGKMVHLGMMIHTPFLAEHSPGKLHIMQLSQHLIEQGKSVLDLTPGGDSWKERFADAHDEVAVAVAYRSSWKKLRVAASDASLSWAKRTVGRIGVTPAAARAAVSKLRQARPATAIRALRNWADVIEEFRIYRGDRALAERFRPDARVKHNSLADLMCFETREATQSRDAFLSGALARLERGESAFTVCIDNRLTHCGWMAEGQAEVKLTQVQQSLRCSLGGVILYDLYSHPEFREQSLKQALLGHMLHLAFANPKVQYVYLPVRMRNLSDEAALATLGLEPIGSFFWQCRAGSERKWATDQMLVNSESETTGA